MLLQHLFESPLGSYDIVGDLTDRGSFEAPDRRTIQSPETPLKIEHAFRHITETIDVVFVPLRFKVKDVNALIDKIGGIYNDPASASKKLNRELPQLSSPDSIMLVLTNNEGNNRVSLSPWIIAHRFGHGIASTDPKPFQNIISCYSDVVNIIDYSGEVSHRSIIYALGTMRSAREKSLNVNIEFSFECFAQYLMTGKVTFNRFTDPVTIDNHVMDRQPAERVNEAISYAEKIINSICRRLVESLKGKVVVL